MTVTGMEADEPALGLDLETPTPPPKSTPPLEHVPCIHYPVRFKKDKAEVQALIDSGIEVNVMVPAYAAKLGLKVWPNDVGA